MPTAVVCPFCKSTEWETLPKKILLREDDSRVIRGGGFSALGFVCSGCGFIRLQMPKETESAE